MGPLKELLEEYDLLGEVGSPHDFVLRQRRLENWAAKAREAIAGLVRSHTETQPAIADANKPFEPVTR